MDKQELTKVGIVVFMAAVMFISISALTSRLRYTTVPMTVTAYCPCESCCDGWSDGFFADGTPVGGLVVAADTDYYPMGTKIFIPGYGLATVRDRGGAIKGNRLDVFYMDHDIALIWGVQDLKVKIYN